MPVRPPQTLARIAAKRRLGARIRQAREESHLNQIDLAKAVGFWSPNTISSIEKGKQGVDALYLWDICRATGKPLAFFLDPNWDEKRPDYPRTLLEWVRLTGGDEDLAQVHHSIDRSLRIAKADAQAETS